MKSLYRRKTKWAAHNIRDSGIFILVTERRMENKRSRGRRRIGTSDSFIKNSYQEFKDLALKM